MGEVYKARDTRLDRTVAIKVLPEHIAQREYLRARFEREARAVAGLNHPNICVLHDIGTQDGAGVHGDSLLWLGIVSRVVELHCLGPGRAIPLHIHLY